MTHPNSIAAYHKIKRDGLLKKLKWVTYDLLFQHGPCTASELAQHFPDTDGGRGGKGNVHARLGELVTRKVARVLPDSRPCKVTGQVVSVYEVTSGLPVEPPKSGRKEMFSKTTLNKLAALYRACTSPEDKKAIQRVVELSREYAERKKKK